MRIVIDGLTSWLMIVNLPDLSAVYAPLVHSPSLRVGASVYVSASRCLVARSARRLSFLSFVALPIRCTPVRLGCGCLLQRSTA